MPPTPVPPAWLRRVGRYELLNPDKDFPIESAAIWLEHGTLGMSYKVPLLSDKTINMPIKPISDTEAVILGLGRDRGETLRAVMIDGEECVRYSGYVGRRVRR